VSVLATGLDNPKQITVDRGGFTYIALSGTAGPADPLLDGIPANHSGAVVRVSPSGAVTPVISGLLSRFVEGSATGPSGVAISEGAVFVAQGIQDPLNSPAGKLLSMPVLKIGANGKVRAYTSFDALPLDPPANNSPDTNPFAMAAGPDGTLYVSDGGENGVWRVDREGDASLFVQFPGNPVVTGLAVIPRAPQTGRNGSKEAGGLVVCLFGNGQSGFSNGSVVTVTSHPGHGGGRKVSTLVPAGTITMPIAAAYSPNGTLYILQFAVPNTNPGPPFAPHSGALWAVDASGTAVKVLGGLHFPTGLAFGPDGAAYIANNGINFAGKGELLKVTGLL
jgi:sugar lactone lactonase YvrE